MKRVKRYVRTFTTFRCNFTASLTGVKRRSKIPLLNSNWIASFSKAFNVLTSPVYPLMTQVIEPASTSGHSFSNVTPKFRCKSCFSAWYSLLFHVVQLKSADDPSSSDTGDSDRLRNSDELFTLSWSRYVSYGCWFSSYIIRSIVTLWFKIV